MTTTIKTVRKSKRAVRVLSWDAKASSGSVAITDHAGKKLNYRVERLALGLYEFESEEGPVYSVRCEFCTCRGFAKTGECKHSGALQCLEARRLLK